MTSPSEIPSDQEIDRQTADRVHDLFLDHIEMMRAIMDPDSLPLIRESEDTP